MRARLAPGQTLAGKPKAGQALALVCGKMELAKDTLSFSGCEPAAAVAEREAARLKNALAAFYQGKPTDAKVATLAINISLYAQELPAGSGCPGDPARCGRPSRRSSCRAWGTRTPYCSACARPAWT